MSIKNCLSWFLRKQFLFTPFLLFAIASFIYPQITTEQGDIGFRADENQPISRNLEYESLSNKYNQKFNFAVNLGRDELTQEQGTEDTTVIRSDGWYNSTATGSRHTFGNYTVPAGSNRLLVLAFASENSGTLNSVKFGGVTMTYASRLTGVENLGHVAIYYLKDADIPSGAQNFTVTFSQSGGTVYGFALFTNVNQISPIVSGGSGTGSATNDYSTYVATNSFNKSKGGLSVAIVLNGDGNKTYAWSLGFNMLFKGNTTPTQSMGGSVAETNAYSSSGTEKAGCTVTSAPNYRLVIAGVCLNAANTSPVIKYLNATPEYFDVSLQAGSINFNIVSNTNWSITSDADWLTVSPTNGSNNGIITVNYAENTEQTALGSSRLSIQQNDNEIIIAVDSLLHLKYGFAYPMTYAITIPLNSSQLKTYKKYQSNQSWSQIQEKSSNDFFNGIESIRYDYANRKAYVSVAFNSNSDSLFIKITNQTGSNVQIEYSNICEYYDNRDAVVTSTADDWMKVHLNTFNKAINIFRSHNLWFSGGIITDVSAPMDAQAWGEIQKQLDSGFVEVSSHTRTHPHPPYDYESEIIGSKNDIINNLNLPSLFRKNEKEYVYAYIYPYGDYNDEIDNVAGSANYLVCRDVYKGFYDFTSWNENKNIYDRTATAYEIGTLYNGETDPAILRSTFDFVLQNHKIYHFFIHPWLIEEYQLWDLLSEHLDYISNRKNIWYTSFGHLYLYHFLEEVVPTIKRRGTITISGGGITRTVTITQDPANQIEVTPSAQSVASAGGETSFKVVSNVNWTVSDNADWLTVVPTNGVNNGGFNALYSDNPNTSPRTCTITVTSGGLFKTVTITQARKTFVPNCPTNMISYWNLNEESGNIFLDCYNGFDGEAGVDGPSAITGIVNGAQQFDGVNDEINILPYSEIDFTSVSNFSVEFWIKHPSAMLGNEVAVGRDDAGTQLHWWVGLDNNGKATFYLISKTGETGSIGGTTSLNDGSWHNVTAIRDASLNQLRIYIDGKLEGTTSATYTNGFDSPTSNLNIGCLNLTGGFHFKGYIDEAAIYNSALDINEIRYNYEKGLAGKGYCDPFALLSSKIYLEGPYNASTDSMSTSINNIIPHTSPYAENPRTVSIIPSGVVDWVLVELRTSATDSAVISKSVFLHKSGNLVCDDGTTHNIILAVAPGNYYIIIKHRNHLAVMCSSAVTFSSPPSVTAYDFTTSITISGDQFYGGSAGAKEIETDVWGMIAGDANGNGKVTYNGAANDKNSVLAEVGLLTPNNVVSGYSNNDTNMDGLVSYNGASNDKNVILKTVGLLTPNNEIITQVP